MRPSSALPLFSLFLCVSLPYLGGAIDFPLSA